MSAPTDRAWLQSRWERLFSAQGIEPTVSRSFFEHLASQYDSADRPYHNLHHLRHVLETIDRLRNQGWEETAVELAAWFHDVIYDPDAGDNEERSASYAERVLRHLEVLDDLILRVKELILLTKTHMASPADRDALILLDADLAILGAPEKEYRRYAAAIRQEYSRVSDDDFRRGRIAVLERFLNRPRIFQTDTMFQLLETQARENLRREITDSGGGH